jgi:hypothetical protein
MTELTFSQITKPQDEILENIILVTRQVNFNLPLKNFLNVLFIVEMQSGGICDLNKTKGLKWGKNMLNLSINLN